MSLQKTGRSRKLYERALKSIPGGASSASRTPLEGYDPYPIFIDRAEGSKLYDVDGNEYIDYLQALGPMFAGHANPRIIDFVSRQIKNGSTYGLPFELQIEVAEKLIRHVPGFEKVSFMNSGSEVVQEVMRLARAYTERKLIVKYEGNYHGWLDSVALSVHTPLNNAGPAQQPSKIAIGAGIPESAYEDILVIPWNDLPVLEKALETYGNRIAGILVDPCMCNSGIIPPVEGYLEALRELTLQNGIVLIFDEVITGFRLGLNSAQGKFGVTPDLTTLAKAVGGGFPVAVYGGRAEIMDLIANGTVFRAGTLNANRAVMAAAYATLEFLEENDGSVYDRVYRLGERLMDGIQETVKRLQIDAIVQGFGTMFQVHFTPLKEFRNYRDAVTSDFEKYIVFRNRLLEQGVFLRPMHWGEIYVSATHSDDDIDTTLVAIDRVLTGMKKEGIF